VKPEKVFLVGGFDGRGIASEPIRGDSSIGSTQTRPILKASARNSLYANGKKIFRVRRVGADEVAEFKVGGTSPMKTLSESVGEPGGSPIATLRGSFDLPIGAISVEK